MGNAISLEIKKTWKEMYRSGLTLREIGKMSGCSKQPVGNYLSSIGVDVKDSRHVNMSTKMAWVKMYEDGLNMKKIGKMVGCSKTTVQKYLDSVGCKIRDRRICPSIKKQWVGLYLDGLCYKDISKKFNRGNGIVETHIKASGVKTRTISEGILNAHKQGKANGGGKGWQVHKGGYIRITRGGDNFNMLQHRAVVEKHLGRKLSDKEIVHHIDENRKNNDIKNLQVMTRGEHVKLHAKLRKDQKKQLKDENKKLKIQVKSLQDEIKKQQLKETI